METPPTKKRFPIFRQLSNDQPAISRTIQVFGQNPELLALSLRQFGQLSLIKLNQSSVTATFQNQRQAELAKASLSSNQRVVQVADPVPASLSKFREEFKKQKISEETGSTLSSMVSESGKEEESEEKKKLRKKPLDKEERSRNVILQDLIWSGEDQRTTVMIKNIPNKYSQSLLLQEIDGSFCGQYDFMYLPIDFKVRIRQNKCNVGYAFINFYTPRVIPRFCQEFSNKRWPKFNSDKVCQLAYARIQGQQALISHFESSSVMNQEDAKVRPLIVSRRQINQD